MDRAVRVLIVDDSEADAALESRELQAAGLSLEVRRVSDRDSLISSLKDFSPQLVLSDFTLERLEGPMALTLAREVNPDLPFLFVSWPVHEGTVVDAIRKGATDYVFKDQLRRLPLSVFRALREAEEREQFKRAQEQVIAQERLTALGQMASGIAHDFSNTLTPILGFSEILLAHPEYWDDHKTLKEYLEIMNTSARDAIQVVERLREFYRKRKNVEAPFPVDLRQVVEQAVLFTKPRWRDQALAAGAMIKVETDLYDLPKVLGNDASFREVLTNLIFNAVDALPQGGTIDFKGRREDEAVVLEVSDNGIGMPEEVRKRCFEPFFSTKGKRGSGMGLSMSYGILRRYDAQLDVRSVQGKGTTFILRFSVYSSHVPNGAVSNAVITPKDAAVSRRPLRILLVDDEPLVLQTLSGYLTGDGHSVESCKDAAEGLKCFEGGGFDLVFTDWAMPGMNGAELARALKSRAGVPIVLITGFADLMKSSPQHVDAVLHKPPTLDSIRNTITSLVSNT